MNIFYLHPDPAKAASFFYDKHKVKMILESAQMLCTAHHVYNNGNNVPYKKAHLIIQVPYGYEIVYTITIGYTTTCLH